LLCSCCFLPSLISYTEHIKYPEPEHNAVNPNDKTTQLARKSSVPPTQDQPQHPKSSSSEAHGASSLQNGEPCVWPS
jgi:hypothetical protein